MSERVAFVTRVPRIHRAPAVAKLLSSDDALRVIALVEPSRLARAERAVEQMNQLTTSDVIRTDRLEIFTGDITALDAGLSGEEFRRVTTTSTEIYHLAALHSVSVDRRMAENVNVRGTSNILGLARAMPRLDRFIHFSSAYVSGDRVGVIMEDELDEGQTFRTSMKRRSTRASSS
ncbi:MAG: hypothetical protein HC923_12875 [Myxococcales bacterium]|nr:hypothetical protein [Myxococcales bacterium]